MDKKLICTIIFILLITTVSFSSSITTAWRDFPSDINKGPYEDEIVFKIIPDQEHRVLALQAGEIDIGFDLLDPVYATVLDADPDISMYRAAEEGYSCITINCAKYPLNISGFRRAFAFAFNKSAVTNDIMDGFAQEHDSLVPYGNGWCIEDQLDWYYYTNQSTIGNQILDDLNFEVDMGTGYRKAPDGSAFNITIEYSAGASSNAIEIVQKCKEALLSLHVDADTTAADHNDLFLRLDTHGDFDMVYHEFDTFPSDVKWLAYEFWSEYADVEYHNWCRFKNSTYDNLREDLINGTLFEQVYEASDEMQRILHYNVPRLVVCVRTSIQAYRNNVFTGYVEDIGRHMSGPWTLRKVRLIHYTYPAYPFVIGISEGPDSFNLYNATSMFSEQIFDELWPSLFSLGPNQLQWPDLAFSMITLNHIDDETIPEGHMKFIIDILQNATWSDGVPLTAEDVEFTFDYILASGVYGLSYPNPVIGSLINVTAVSEYRVVLEYETDSFWHFNEFAYEKIIPKHIFYDETGISYEEWRDWNPVFNVTHPHVTCGPFLLVDYDRDYEFYWLARNSLFHYLYYEPYTPTSHVDPPPPPNGNVILEVLIQLSPFLILGTLLAIVVYHDRRSQAAMST